MTDIARGLLGYGTVARPEDPVLAGTEAWSAGQWQSDFEETLVCRL